MPRRLPADPYPPGFEPFIQAIQADVGADLPRLQFADWLDDHGDPDRAEFIRLQCAFTRWDAGGLQGTGFDITEAGLTAAEKRTASRLHDLFVANKARWLFGLPDWATREADWLRFQRGFIGRFHGGPKQFTAADWAAVRRLTPVESVWVGKLRGAEDSVLRSDALSGVANLYLTNADAAALAALAGSPVLPSLRTLFLTGRGPPVAAGVYAALFGSPGLANLRDLIVLNLRPGDDVAAAVTGAALRGLQSLGLSGTRLGPAGVSRLVSKTWLATVTHLDLGGNPLGDAGVRALVESSQVRNLRELTLSECRIGLAGVRLLAGWPGLRTVRTLRLDGNPVPAAALQALGESPHAQDLAALDLPDADVTAAEWTRLARLPVFARITAADPFALKNEPVPG